MSYEGLKTFLDSRRFPADSEFSYDVCIIGAGPAGISIAREFANTGTRVALLESGGLWREDEIESLNKIVVTGHDYDAEGSRLRFFGGAANHWNGHCVPMTPGSLEEREWIPDSGWPLPINDLHAYYARAHEIIEIGPYDFRAEACAERLRANLLPFDPAIVKTQVSRFHRQNFGARYAEALDTADNISVFLYATVTSINLDDHKRFVNNVTVRTLAQNSFSVKAKIFVIAAGGVENARLLLLSNRGMSNGLGNQNNIVGRYFMDHIAYKGGFILPLDNNPQIAQFYGAEVYCDEDYDMRAHLVLSEASLRKLRIPEFRAQLDVGPSRWYLPSVRSASNFKRFLRSGNPASVTFEDIANLVRDPRSPLEYIADVKGGPFLYGFANFCEQCPNRESRVTLAEERDAFGQNLTRLHWQLCGLDITGIARAQRLIAEQVGRSGIGRMKVFLSEISDQIPPTVRGLAHHMGTTRMSSDPKRGVVDANCRIHGTENAFVAGSSVFPTGGYANPTLTLTALALRLADHLKIKLARL